jgi:hypothetical protein
MRNFSKDSLQVAKEGTWSAPRRALPPSAEAFVKRRHESSKKAETKTEHELLIARSYLPPAITIIK